MAETYYLLALVTLGVVGGTLANWHRSQLASPLDSTSDVCGRRGVKSYVCDPDKVLTFTQANQLDRTINRIINETRCPCSSYRCNQDHSGYYVAIAIAPTILSDAEMKKMADGEDNYIDEDMTPRERMHHTELFAYTLLKNWDMGRCHEDIVIAFDPRNYAMFTVGGTTALKRLTPDLIGEITMSNRDEFAKGTYQGLQKMLADYRLVLLNKYDSKPVYSYKPKTAAVVGGDGGASHLVPPTAVSLLAVVLFALW